VNEHFYNGFIKRAQDYGISSSNAVVLYNSVINKEAEDRLEKAKINPLLASVLGILPHGEFINIGKAAVKDVQNKDIHDYASEAEKIDPLNAASKERTKYLLNNTAKGIMAKEQFKNAIKGLLIGAAAGGVADIGAVATGELFPESVKPGGFTLTDFIKPVLMGGTAGYWGGTAYGANQGARKYNNLLNEKYQKTHPQVLTPIIPPPPFIPSPAFI
jgi:hypothetical protein